MGHLTKSRVRLYFVGASARIKSGSDCNRIARDSLCDSRGIWGEINRTCVNVKIESESPH